MAINEFRWGVKPAIPGHWHIANLEHDGFEVEITANWIQVRCEDNGQGDAQQRHAQEIVAGIVRKIGLTEQTRFTGTLGSLSQCDPQSGRRDNGISLSDDLGVKWSDHADLVVASADGTVLADSREERMAELFRFEDDATDNDTLCRMSDYLLDYFADPDKKLAPLFDIIELAEQAFGTRKSAATSLGTSVSRWNDARAIINDSTIHSGRHRGQELGQQRDPTPAEVQLCEAIATKIVDEYAKLVRCGTAPR